ncbi:Disease resistance protein RGA2 [Camellia lanceoleosa]|nr:Disease resistance protein RGA2 [Camellia lanceoleosa]
MAETAVFHLLANFAPFLQQEANLLTEVRDKIQYIRDEFDCMTAFLRVADAMEENDPELKLVHEDPGLKVLSVSGMSGLGKTTMVKKVFDDAVVKNHFQSHVWIIVSESFKIEVLLKGIIKQLFE